MAVKKETKKEKIEKTRTIDYNLSHTLQQEQNSAAVDAAKEVSELPKKNFLKKIKKLLFRPTSFLESVDKENRYPMIINTLLIISVIYFIFLTISGLIITGIGSSIIEYLKSTMTLFVKIVLFAILFPFVLSGIVHLGVLVFRGKEKFIQTFKPVTYALVIGVVYSIIAVIVSFAIQLFIPIDASMIQSLSSTTLDPQASLNAQIAYYSQPAILVTIIISLIAYIHEFIFMFRGIAKLQKMSKVKAAFAVAIPIAIVLFILFLILISIALSMNLNQVISS
ncbi:MAG: YIP1 family protein [Candidatus Pacearchaeota archaeon]|jgi:hypothetical protein